MLTLFLNPSILFFRVILWIFSRPLSILTPPFQHVLRPRTLTTISSASLHSKTIAISPPQSLARSSKTASISTTSSRSLLEDRVPQQIELHGAPCIEAQQCQFSIAPTTQPLVDDKDKFKVQFYESLVSQADATNDPVLHAEAAQCKIWGFGTSIDMHQGFDELLKLVNEYPRTELLYSIGVCYYNGYCSDGKVNKSAAYQCFQRAIAAADASDPSSTRFLTLAQYRCAKMLAEGDGVQADPIQAIDYFKQAAHHGNCRAQCALGWHYQKTDLKQARYWFQRAVDQSYPDAQAALGVLLIQRRLEFPSSVRDQNSSYALDLLRQAADKNVIPAILQLGSLYSEGTLVDRHIAKAIHYFEQALNLSVTGPDEAVVHYLLGLSYCDEAATIQGPDHARAIHHLEAATEAGYAPAQRTLGHMYYKGMGVTKDEKKALQLFQKAAHQKDTRALGFLGEQYEFGRGCSLDLQKALTLYEQAAKLGSVLAELSLALLLHRMGRRGEAYTHFDKVVHWNSELSAEREHDIVRVRHMARLMLIRYRFNGWANVQRDPSSAFEDLLRLANDDKFPEAYYWVGAGYKEGIVDAQDCTIVEPDPLRALEYFEAGAKQGDVDAQVSAADMLSNGFTYRTVEGNKVMKDRKRAFDWYQQAAEGGHAVAQHCLGLYYYKGLNPVTIDLAMAQRLFERAAHQKYAASMVMLGQLLMKKHQPPRADRPACVEDYKQAFYWLKRASTMNDAGAYRELAALYNSGIGIDVSDQQRYMLGLQCVDKAIAMGDTMSWCVKSQYHENGWAVPRDLDEALACLKEAQQKGYTKANLLVAELYERQSLWSKALQQYSLVAQKHGLLTQVGWLARLAKSQHVVLQRRGNDKDKAEVYGWLRDMVKQNAGEASVDPRYLLGQCCDLAIGTVQDIDEAMVWYEAAIAQETTAFSWAKEHARFRLSQLYVEREKHAQAIQQFRRLEPHLDRMNHHSPETRYQARQVRYYLGYLLLHHSQAAGDKEEAIQWLTQAADEGEGHACFELGMLAIERGNDTEARKRFDQGASANHPGCMRELAMLLEREQRADLNWDGIDAYDWLDRARQLGDIPALIKLGLAHQNGLGNQLIGGDFQTALHLFEEAARQNNTQAIVYAGEACRTMGLHLKAVEWFRKAPTHLVSKVMLADYCLQGRGGVQKNHAKAFEDLKAVYREYDSESLAEEESKVLSFGYFLIGQCYEQGQGVELDCEEAKQWYQRAVDKGQSLDAIFYLGQLHYQEGNVEAAFECFEKAAASGLPEALYRVGVFHWQGLANLEPNLVVANKYLSRASERGHARATYELGLLQYNQEKFSEAVENLDKAAKLRVPEALRMLGNFYHEGTAGVRQNYATAFAYFWQAAQLNDGLSALMVGSYFEKGYDKQHIDRYEALQWYIRADELQCGPLAQLAIGTLEHTMADEIQDKEQAEDLRANAFSWFQRAATSDTTVTHAQIMVALYQLNGWGRVPRDPVKGFTLLLEVAKAGGSEAFVEVAKCYEEGIGVQRDQESALSYWRDAAAMEDVEAIERVGYYHQHGLGGEPVNDDEAKQCYALADQIRNRQDEKENSIASASTASTY
ncbi:uncharacterized protein BYT42DRAFT_589295 [Radiomyces spectabilis]|uniref:uncharacterized protein n=1 Tax=Radiomyces spectabilis TaxID=64574 RepID=UPI00221E3949|nr:uncharacterized protein BYT42DRAFT_589295 [Radiomyces spectabilis]KAI8365243.1 hypothetical protein BYT42DRAFT_589295 [Radiomyces spectabilis]